MTRATGAVSSAPASARSRQRTTRVSGSSLRWPSLRIDGWRTAAVQKMYDAIHGQLTQAPPEYAPPLILNAAVAPGAHDQHHRQRRENRVGDEVEVVGDRRLCRVRGDVEGDVACDEERVAEGEPEPRQARLGPQAPDAPEDRGDGATAEDL